MIAGAWLDVDQGRKKQHDQDRPNHLECVHFDAPRQSPVQDFGGGFFPAP
jgi:hypothetical protein